MNITWRVKTFSRSSNILPILPLPSITGTSLRPPDSAVRATPKLLVTTCHLQSTAGIRASSWVITVNFSTVIARPALTRQILSLDEIWSIYLCFSLSVLIIRIHRSWVALPKSIRPWLPKCLLSGSKPWVPEWWDCWVECSLFLPFYWWLVQEQIDGHSPQHPFRCSSNNLVWSLQSHGPTCFLDHWWWSKRWVDLVQECAWLRK